MKTSTSLQPLAPNEGPSEAKLTLMPRADGSLIQFKPFLQVLAENEAKAMAMTISADMPPEQRKAVAKEARALRLDCFRQARLGADKAKTSLKADVLEFTRAVDKKNGEIWDRCEAIEKHLEDIERFEENERRRVEQENRQSRAAEIAPFLTGPTSVDLGIITEGDYQRMLADAKELHAVRQERDRKEKEEQEAILKAAADERRRIAAEKEEERQRVAAENARLRAEAEARAQEVERERQRVEEERRKEREAAAAAQRAIEAKAQAEREAAAAAARKEKARMDAERAALEAEQAKERARLKAEADKAGAERKRLADAETARLKKEADEKKAAALAAKKAAAAPDIQKLAAFIISEEDKNLPELRNGDITARINGVHQTYVRSLKTIAAMLENPTF